MLRTLSLATALSASCAAGALALAPVQAYVFANFASAAIDAQAHAQGIAVAMLAFGAGLVGIALSGTSPFVDRVATRSRASTEGLRAVEAAVISRPTPKYRYIDTPTGRRKQDTATGRFVPLVGTKSRRRPTRTAVPAGK